MAETDDADGKAWETMKHGGEQNPAMRSVLGPGNTNPQIRDKYKVGGLLNPTPIRDHDPAVNHPSHYNQGGIEVIDFIDAWGMDFNTGNVIKYVARAPYKGKTLEDLKKARFYLERLIAIEERKGK